MKCYNFDGQKIMDDIESGMYDVYSDDKELYKGKLDISRYTRDWGIDVYQYYDDRDALHTRAVNSAHDMYSRRLKEYADTYLGYTIQDTLFNTLINKSMFYHDLMSSVINRGDDEIARARRQARGHRSGYVFDYFHDLLSLINMASLMAKRAMAA